MKLIFKNKFWNSSICKKFEKMLAGTAGFEPANASTKNWCLTTWRRPTKITLTDRF